MRHLTCINPKRVAKFRMPNNATFAARTILRRFYDYAKANGADGFFVFCDPVPEPQTAAEFVERVMDHSEATVSVLFDDDELTQITLIPGNGIDLFSDWNVTPWSKKHIHKFLDQIEKEATQ